jgi:hypothetical protein
MLERASHSILAKHLVSGSNSGLSEVRVKRGQVLYSSSISFLVGNVDVTPCTTRGMIN